MPRWQELLVDHKLIDPDEWLALTLQNSDTIQKNPLGYHILRDGLTFAVLMPSFNGGHPAAQWDDCRLFRSKVDFREAVPALTSVEPGPRYLYVHDYTNGYEVGIVTSAASDPICLATIPYFVLRDYCDDEIRRNPYTRENALATLRKLGWELVVTYDSRRGYDLNQHLIGKYLQVYFSTSGLGRAAQGYRAAIISMSGIESGSGHRQDAAFLSRNKVRLTHSG